ncbi:MAG: methyltransferase family protein [Candidatus Aminicenantales bacterium]
MTGFWIALVAGTVLLLVFTWFSSIREKRYHGYPRFFAFESVFVLVLLNWNVWFRDPLSLRQIISWLLFLAAIAVVAAGFHSLSKYGKPREGNFENTTRLVNRGIFRFIRHPMYASLIYLGVGVFLKGMRPATAIVLAVDLATCLITALMEEREMVAKFGDEYAAYKETTKRFIPFVI